MKRLLLLFFFVFSLSVSLLAQSGRKTIYPVIFVHGLVGSDGTWYKTIQQFQQSGYNVSIDHSRVNYGLSGGAGAGSRIDFNLNADGLVSKATTDFFYKLGKFNYGDVQDLQSPIDGNNDVFVVNFNTAAYSNQSAIYKQGFALGIAINKVLAATNAEKVILVGHSMGGLAIREYLQTSRFLFENQAHRVYRVVTIGTPHGGSNTGTGDLNVLGLVRTFYDKFVDERSEAVRDLRSTHTASGKPGVYLFGGNETDATYGIVGVPYNNTDINCNGQTDAISGLNSKAKISALPTDIYYECIVSEVGNLGSDLVVTTESQNLNKYAQKQVDGLIYDFAVVTKIKNVAHVPLGSYEGESDQAYTLIKSSMLMINIPIVPATYMVFLTGYFDGSFTEGTASFFLDIPTKGILDINYVTAKGLFTKILLQKDNAVGAYVVNAPQTDNWTTELTKGRYFLTLYGRMNYEGYSTAKLALNFKPEVLANESTVVAESLVYPNPTDGFLHIQADTKAQIECFDRLGKSIPFKTDNGGIYIEEKGLVLVRIGNKSHRVLVE